MKTWSANWVISSSLAVNQGTIFATTDTKLYVSVETLSTKDDANLLQWLKPGFKITNNWNKYQSKVTLERQNPLINWP